ncbi:hypothetical protein [Paraprevotella clara]|uniref:hypothetical protein n=1 Tax=Paraprevotella clara TaxID=454154 RepID=UPI00266C7D6E|nr:hypothetical protein [Paraprevotella clara]
MGKSEFQKSNNQQKCFIITPVGNPDSEIRKKADGVINAIIKPVLYELGYEAIPPHEMSKSGSITQQVIEHIINDDLVIANLTGLNPNVMYELAIRHCVKKPIVCIIERNTQLPFDVATERFIIYDDNFSNVISLKDNIKKMIMSIKDNEIDNPIYRSIKEIDIVKKISESKDPNSNALKLILNRLGKIENEVNTRYTDNFNKKFNTDFYALIKLGNNNICDKTLSQINSLIIEHYISHGIMVALIYNKEKNEIIVENGNVDNKIIDDLISLIEIEFDFSDIGYELLPF